jgi:hypothetical protein
MCTQSAVDLSTLRVARLQAHRETEDYFWFSGMLVQPDQDLFGTAVLERNTRNVTRFQMQRCILQSTNFTSRLAWLGDRKDSACLGYS